MRFRPQSDRDDNQSKLSDDFSPEADTVKKSESQHDSGSPMDDPAVNELGEGTESNTKPPTDIKLTHSTARTRDILGPRQLCIWERDLEDFAEWMRSRGRDTDEYEGMAEDSLVNTIKRIDKIARWWWNQGGSKDLRLSHTAANDYNNALAKDQVKKSDGEPYAAATKDKDTEALQKYFEWQANERGGAKWSPEHEFEETTNQHADAFTKEERRLLRETALEYDSLPSYDDVSPQQREELSKYLAMRLEKPKSEVKPDDWKRVGRSWKIPSLIWVALDIGLRPIEVERSTEDWPRLEKDAFYIPKSKSAKNRDHWECAIRSQTAEIMRRWLEERTHRTKYAGRDALWLTREGNPYASAALCYLLRKICDEAGIDRTNRQICWYSIRHSVGDLMTPEGGLQQTKEQLRQKSLQSTLRYQSPTVDDRQDTLNRMG